jgi:hypothetical protein
LNVHHYEYCSLSSVAVSVKTRHVVAGAAVYPVHDVHEAAVPVEEDSVHCDDDVEEDANMDEVGHRWHLLRMMVAAVVGQAVVVVVVPSGGDDADLDAA